MILTRIIYAPLGLEGDLRHVTVDAFGGVVARGVVPRAPLAANDRRDILVIPGADAVARWLYLPTRNDRQALSAARLQVGDHLALADEDLHVAIGPPQADDQRLTVVIRKETLQAWLRTAALHGFEPQVVLPDYMILPEPEAPGFVWTATLGESLLARGSRLALSVDRDIAALVLGAHETRALGDVAASETLLAALAGRAEINLLQGDFNSGRNLEWGWPLVRRSAVVGGLLLLSPLVLLAATALRDDIAARAIERDISAQVAAVLPKGTVVSDPVGQASARLASLQLAAGGGPAGLAAQLFATVETIEQAQLETLTLGPDGALRASIVFGQISDLELLRRGLRARGLAFREEGARDEGGRVVADVILGLRQ